MAANFLDSLGEPKTCTVEKRPAGAKPPLNGRAGIAYGTEISSGSRGVSSAGYLYFY